MSFEFDYEIITQKITRKPGVGIFIKLSSAGEYGKCNFSITQDCELFGLLDQSLPPL